MLSATEKIIILPRGVREKIRAGEVVDRPASIVKELIENSIDAQSTRVICEVDRGGLERIKVIDNGLGMSPLDLERSLERYATSKIRGLSDLSCISTFGFRGEALPSIKAVSDLVIESKLKDAETGFLIRANGEEIVEKRPQPAKVGTTVDVRKIFFNTPARRKFLKSESTEFRHIRRVFVALALENRKVHFTLFNNGKLNLEVPPSNGIKERFKYILEGDIVNNLLTFSNDDKNITIEGVISKPEKAVSGRDFQYIFVNRRWVSNNVIRQAIYKAYGNSLWGKHPIFVVEIFISGTEIDINVHPMKKEVKFSKAKDIFELVYNSVKDTLKSKSELPELDKERVFYLREEEKGFAKQEEHLLFSSEKIDVKDYKGEKTIPKGLWQLHNSYIFASTKTGFMIVDQHAAHERILFDKIIRRKEQLPPQMLLFPLRIELSISEEEFLQGSVEIFYELGFRIKKFSGKTIIVEGIPPFMKEINEDVIHDLFEFLEENVREKGLFNEIAKQIACKSAIKAGEELKQEEMNILIDNLFATDEPYTCPHGRPTMIKFTLDELEKKFKRK
ncbi:DNA mismatch repair endonuclease MutL [candidate division WOR-3 bacterium]|nr:DNA mismatch repair endonuclease MutL [candidate division WOR-3 bacterium]